jgi:hypothetical protein
MREGNLTKCEEREHLWQARQNAQREHFELEEKLGHLLVSPTATCHAKPRMRFNAHIAEVPMPSKN